MPKQPDNLTLSDVVQSWPPESRIAVAAALKKLFTGGGADFLLASSVTMMTTDKHARSEAALAYPRRTMEHLHRLLNLEPEVKAETIFTVGWLWETGVRRHDPWRSVRDLINRWASSAQAYDLARVEPIRLGGLDVQHLEPLLFEEIEKHLPDPQDLTIEDKASELERLLAAYGWEWTWIDLFSDLRVHRLTWNQIASKNKWTLQQAEARRHILRRKLRSLGVRLREDVEERRRLTEIVESFGRVKIGDRGISGSLVERIAGKSLFYRAPRVRPGQEPTRFVVEPR